MKKNDNIKFSLVNIKKLQNTTKFEKLIINKTTLLRL